MESELGVGVKYISCVFKRKIVSSVLLNVKLCIYRVKDFPMFQKYISTEISMMKLVRILQVHTYTFKERNKDNNKKKALGEMERERARERERKTKQMEKKKEN